MAKAKVAPGDICLIPVPEQGFAVAKVLYCLQRFKNIVLIGVWTGGSMSSAWRGSRRCAAMTRLAHRAFDRL